MNKIVTSCLNFHKYQLTILKTNIWITGSVLLSKRFINVSKKIPTTLQTLFLASFNLSMCIYMYMTLTLKINSLCTPLWSLRPSQLDIMGGTFYLFWLAGNIFQNDFSWLPMIISQWHFRAWKNLSRNIMNDFLDKLINIPCPIQTHIPSTCITESTDIIISKL